jgi:hypothetical protein
MIFASLCEKLIPSRHLQTQGVSAFSRVWVDQISWQNKRGDFHTIKSSLTLKMCSQNIIFSYNICPWAYTIRNLRL